MDIFSIKKRIDDYRYRDLSKLRITPYRDWATILTMAIFLFIAVVIFSYFVYMREYVYGTAMNTEEPVAVKDSSIDLFKKDLDQTFAYFEKKKEYHQKLLKEKQSFNSYVYPETKKEILQEAVVSTTSTSTKEKDNKTASTTGFLKNTSNAAATWGSSFIDLFH